MQEILNAIQSAFGGLQNPLESETFQNISDSISKAMTPANETTALGAVTDIGNIGNSSLRTVSSMQNTAIHAAAAQSNYAREYNSNVNSQMDIERETNRVTGQMNAMGAASGATGVSSANIESSVQSKFGSTQQQRISQNNQAISAESNITKNAFQAKQIGNVGAGIDNMASVGMKSNALHSVTSDFMGGTGKAVSSEIPTPVRKAMI